MRRCLDDERGSSDTVAMMFIVPVVFGVVMLFVFFGRQGTAAEGVTHAAHVAAVAAAHERSAGAAQNAAVQAAATTLSAAGTACAGGPGIAVLADRWAPGGIVSVTVTCSVGRDDLDAIGAPARTLQSSSRAVIDVFRGFEPWSALRTLWRRIRLDERGAGYLAAFIVLFGVLTVAGVGVLVDSARIVSAERHASAAAFEAARAGAQAVNVGSARGGASMIDTAVARQAAASAASDLLAGSDARLEAVAVTGGEILVTITRDIDPWFPIIDGRTVRETGRARLAVGITEEGQ